MRKVLRRLLALGALAGLLLAVRGYLERGGFAADGAGGRAGEEVAQVTFDDGSTRTLTAASAEGRELAEIARKILEVGL